jgi:hypothetical protein
MINDFLETRYRPLPLIQTYNSNLENTRRMVPNDTLYVEVNNLVAGQEYVVRAINVDESGTESTISEFILTADEDGKINPTALWYDIGFLYDEHGNIFLAKESLSINSFYIEVQDQGESAGTNFRLPFWIVSKNDNFERTQPIIMAGKYGDFDSSGENSFFVENAFYSDGNVPTEEPNKSDALFVQVENMTPLLEGETDHPVRVYIIPFEGESIEDGSAIGLESYFYIDKIISDFTDEGNPVAINIPWPSTQPDDYNIDVEDVANQTSIPAWAEGKAFSVFLDMRDRGGELDVSGEYNIKEDGSESFYLDSIDGNGVAGFIVKEPPTVAGVEIPLASGGKFKGQWQYDESFGYWRYKYDYDYRYDLGDDDVINIVDGVYEDAFLIDGKDTKFSSHSGPYWGYGVKVIWNPYLSPSGWVEQGIDYEDIPSNFYGRWVDVYIIRVIDRDDKTSFLDTDNSILSKSIVRRARLPVQYGCSNGWWQQTVWRAYLNDPDFEKWKQSLSDPSSVTDKYYNVVVDMDFQYNTSFLGTYDQSVDILGKAFRVVESVSTSD